MKQHGATHRIVVTGGPGGGKTALLDFIQKSVPAQFVVIPEAASIIFNGGFWRRPSIPGRKAVQRAVFHVQREMERLLEEEAEPRFVLCDRGSLDGLAYWPGPESEFFTELQTSRENEVRRYATIIHLCTPGIANGYNHVNPLRTETPAEALAIDERILLAWEGHPNRHIIASTTDFKEKIRLAMEILQKEIP